MLSPSAGGLPLANWARFAFRGVVIESRISRWTAFGSPSSTEDLVATEKPPVKVSLVVRTVPESPGWASLWRWLLSPGGRTETEESLPSELEELCQEQTKSLMQSPDLPGDQVPGKVRRKNQEAAND